MQGVKVYSWGDATGYGVAGSGYVRLLAASGTPVTWQPMMAALGGYRVATPHTSPLPELSTWFLRQIEVDTVLIHSVPESYPPIIDVERAAGHRVYAYTVWEFDHVPLHWPKILNQLDGVLVPSSWNAEVFRASGVTVPLSVVPHVSQFEDENPPTPSDHERLRRRLQPFEELEGRSVFYTIGHYSERKATNLVVEAFARAFTGRDDVALIVKTSAQDVTRMRRTVRSGFRKHFPDPTWSVGQILRRFPDPPVVRVIATEDLTTSEIHALHEYGDCFVSLSRGEGWGMGAFEAARCGNPVITTRTGGVTCYLAEDHPTFVDLNPRPRKTLHAAAADAAPEPDLDQAVRLLRAFSSNVDAWRAQADSQRVKIRADYNSASISADLLAAIA